LLELCGLVEARVIDPDGVYDPCRANDRLLLGRECAKLWAGHSSIIAHVIRVTLYTMPSPFESTH
jgi:hypothetical protein